MIFGNAYTNNIKKSSHNFTNFWLIPKILSTQIHNVILSEEKKLVIKDVFEYTRCFLLH